MNLAGSRVTENMVFLSDLLVKGIDFYKEYSDVFNEKLADNKLGDLMPKKSAEISIPLATLNAAYVKINEKKRTSNLSPIP
ncbi:hypothetical protein [Carnobacterium maltaromaticum]|uniref:hypothetical protein n=1 Tax=Carnobacterium maltaromaticum TaxID=2751 RepID=UPI0011AE28A9|nr:hypothetical protein [Carnobacterium maltaromaticum]